MERNICQIRVGNEQGTEFFCKIPFPDKHNKKKDFLFHFLIQINLKNNF